MGRFFHNNKKLELSGSWALPRQGYFLRDGNQVFEMNGMCRAFPVVNYRNFPGLEKFSMVCCYFNNGAVPSIIFRNIPNTGSG